MTVFFLNAIVAKLLPKLHPSVTFFFQKNKNSSVTQPRNIENTHCRKISIMSSFISHPGRVESRELQYEFLLVYREKEERIRV